LNLKQILPEVKTNKKIFFDESVDELEGIEMELGDELNEIK